MVETLRGKSVGTIGWEKWVAIIILIGTFFLFTHNLTAEGLWRDEGLSYSRAMQPVRQIFKGQNIIQGIATPDLHPPGYFLMLKGIIFLGGESEFTLRILSVFGAVLATATIGRLTADLVIKKRFASTIAMLVIASSPFVYWYAREARMYSWLLFAVALFYWRLGLLLSKQQSQPLLFRTDWLPLFLATGLLASVHISAIFVIAFGVVGLFLLIPGRQWRIPLIALSMGGTCLILISFTEWGISMLTERFKFFYPRPLSQLLSETTTTFSLGGATLPGSVWPLFSLLIILATLGYIVHLTGIFQQGFSDFGQSQVVLLITLFALFVPLILFYLASFVQPGYSNPRHLMILAVPWFLSISGGIMVIYSRSSIAGILLAGVVIFIGGRTIIKHQVKPPVVKDQLRELRAFVEKRMLPTDTLLFHQPALTNPWQYYEIENLNTISYPRWSAPMQSDLELTKFLEEVEVSGRIWFVDSLGRESNIEDWLNDNWQAQQRTNFKGSWTNMSATLYLPPDLTQMPIEQPLINQPMQVEDIEVSQLVANNRPVSGNIFWVTGQFRTSKSEPICLALESSSGDFVTEDCFFTSLGSSSIGFGLELPLGLNEETYQLRLQFPRQFSDPIPLNIMPIRLPRSAAILQRGEVSLFPPEPLGETFYPGKWMNFDVVWQLVEQSSDTVSVDTAWRLNNWRTGSVIDLVETVDVSSSATRQRLNFFLPPNALGSYRLQVQAGSGRWQTVSTVDVTQWPIVDTLPENAQVMTEPHRFADGMSLAGYCLDRRGDQLDVTLFWQTEQTPEDDWLVFIHVTEPGHPPAAQTANRPSNAVRLTEGWRPGEIIEDVHTLTLPQDLTLAQSNIFVGLFLASDPNVRAPLQVNGEPKSDGLFFVDGVPQP